MNVGSVPLPGDIPIYSDVKGRVSSFISNSSLFYLFYFSYIKTYNDNNKNILQQRIQGYHICHIITLA